MDAFAPNALNPEQASALLAGGPFAAALAGGAALVIATGHPARIAFATPAGLAMFGAPDLAALEAAVVGAQSPGARRLRQLAQSLAIGAAPRMEQLRFFAGRSPILLGLLCARVAGPNGSSFLVAAAPRSAPVEAPRSGFEVEGDSLADDHCHVVLRASTARRSGSLPLESELGRTIWASRSGACRATGAERAASRRIGRGAVRTAGHRSRRRLHPGARRATNFLGVAARLARTGSGAGAGRLDVRRSAIRPRTEIRRIPRLWSFHRRERAGRRARLEELRASDAIRRAATAPNRKR